MLDLADLLVAGVLRKLEEGPDLPGPLVEVGLQDREPLVLGHLVAAEVAGLAPDLEIALGLDPDVPHPLGGPARGDQVGGAVDLERVHRSGPGLAAFPALYRERLRAGRSEEHTSELQSQSNLVCRLLLEKKKKK